MNHISLEKGIYAKSPTAQDTFQPCMHDKHMHVQLHHDDMLKTTLHMHFPYIVEDSFLYIPHNTRENSGSFSDSTQYCVTVYINTDHVTAKLKSGCIHNKTDVVETGEP